MKNAIITIFLVAVATLTQAQGINAAYVKALYAKYPTAQSGFCAACRIWVNPYYTSIADTVKNYPVL